MPPFAALAHAGMVEGLAVVKRRRSEGSIVKSLSIEIVRVVFALLPDNHGLPPRMGHAPRGPRWAEISLSFLWKIEIAFHFYSELIFDKSYKIM